MKKPLRLASLVLLLGACACPDRVVGPISAMEGGELTLPSGDATLRVPAGALTEDVEITMERVALAERPVLEDSYGALRVGPNLTLRGPVSITWRIPRLREDARFELHRYEDGAWRRLDASITRSDEGAVATSVAVMGELALVVHTPRGGLRARVIDRTSKVGPRLSGVAIGIRSERGTERLGVSNEDGEVATGGLLPGEYEVSIQGDADTIACGNSDWLTQLAVIEPDDETLVLFAIDPRRASCP